MDTGLCPRGERSALQLTMEQKPKRKRKRKIAASMYKSSCQAVAVGGGLAVRRRSCVEKKRNG